MTFLLFAPASTKWLKDDVTLIVQSYFDTLRLYVLSVTFCGVVVMKVMDHNRINNSVHFNTK